MPLSTLNKIYIKKEEKNTPPKNQIKIQELLEKN